MRGGNIKQIDSINEVLKSIEYMDIETLRETLAYIIKIYILDKEIAYEGPVYDGINSKIENRDSFNPVCLTELIRECQKRFAIPELNLFSVEDEKTYITLNGEKRLLSTRDSKNEAPAKSPENRKKSDDNAASNKNPSQSNGRFRNLEMD